MNRTERLKERLDALGCACLCEEPMSRHTSFQIGGPAELFVSPSDREQTAAVLAACREQEIPFFLMGNGSNLLVADEGVRGAVIAFGAPMSRIVRQGDALLAQAGATLSQLCRFARQEGLSGLEFAWGIPGSGGGAVRMNAGAYGGEMVQVLTAVTYLDGAGEERTLPAAECALTYRHSLFSDHPDWLVLEAELGLQPGDAEAIQARMDELAAKRREKQPLEWPSAGSTFKRPEGRFAAALIEECGLKGTRVGGAQVSEKHAGFLVNRGGATADDVRRLIARVQETVLARTGVALEPEVKFLGF